MKDKFNSIKSWCKNNKVISTVIAALLIVILFFSVKISYAEYMICKVKNSYAEEQPNYTVEQCFDDFLGNPEWKYKKVNGDKIVYVKGTCYYMDTEVEAVQEFIVRGDSWKTTNLYMDGKIVNDFVSAGFRSKVFKK